MSAEHGYNNGWVPDNTQCDTRTLFEEGQRARSVLTGQGYGHYFPTHEAYTRALTDAENGVPAVHTTNGSRNSR